MSKKKKSIIHERIVRKIPSSSEEETSSTEEESSSEEEEAKKKKVVKKKSPQKKKKNKKYSPLRRLTPPPKKRKKKQDEKSSFKGLKNKEIPLNMNDNIVSSSTEGVVSISVETSKASSKSKKRVSQFFQLSCLLKDVSEGLQRCRGDFLQTSFYLVEENSRLDHSTNYVYFDMTTTKTLREVGIDPKKKYAAEVGENRMEVSFGGKNLVKKLVIGSQMRNIKEDERIQKSFSVPTKKKKKRIKLDNFKPSSKSFPIRMNSEPNRSVSNNAPTKNPPPFHHIKRPKKKEKKKKKKIGYSPHPISIRECLGCRTNFEETDEVAFLMRKNSEVRNCLFCELKKKAAEKNVVLENCQLPDLFSFINQFCKEIYLDKNFHSELEKFRVEEKKKIREEKRKKRKEEKLKKIEDEMKRRKKEIEEKKREMIRKLEEEMEKRKEEMEMDVDEDDISEDEDTSDDEESD